MNPKENIMIGALLAVFCGSQTSLNALHFFFNNSHRMMKGLLLTSHRMQSCNALVVRPMMLMMMHSFGNAMMRLDSHPLLGCVTGTYEL
jgi:hypothetical protein